MDSPPECVLALSCEPPLSPPAMPSLDHSPLAATESSPQSSAAPSPQAPTDGSLSPFPRLLNHQLDAAVTSVVNGEALEDELEGLDEELEEEEDEAMSAPPSPTPAVALFPGEGAGAVSGPPPPRESPPGSPPSVPSGAGFVALEMALSAASSSTTTAGAPCGEDDGELDLQLFRRDAAMTSAASAPSLTTGGAAAGLRFPCDVCGKRFRFQSILSLHARAHRLDRQRRATVLYHTGRDACKPPQHAPMDQLQERSLMTNQECATDQSVQKNPEANLERSLDGRSPEACLEIIPERRRNRRKRTVDRRPEPRLDQRVDPNFGTSPDGSLESSPRETIHHEDSLQTHFSPHFMSDPFQSPSLTPPPTKEAPIMAAFAPLLPSHLEDPVQTTDGSAAAAAGATAAASSFRCNECKGKFRTASELARHTRILHNPYKCTMCPFSASQEERLATHLRDSHPAPSAAAPHEHKAPPPKPRSTKSLSFSPQRIRENPTPPELPVTITALNAGANAGVNTSAANSQTSGGAPLPAFRCETCGQRFTQSWFLKGHMRKHKDSLDHKCQVCGRGFKEPWFLKNHMKVHLNKLGLKAGLAGLGLGPVPGGGELASKGSGGGGGSRGKNQSLSALYSSLLLARAGGGAAGGGGVGVFGGGVGGGAGSRAERELAAAVAAATAAAAAGSGSGSSKASILSYLGLPGAEGASCVERLQAVAQVAEMGNGERRERERERDRERTREERPEATHGGGGGGGGNEAVDQVAMWQLVARSLAAAQHSHQQQQQQQKARSRPHQPHQPLSQPRGSVAGEAEQLRAYLGGLGGPGTGSSGSGGGGGGREREDHHLVTASSGSSGAGGAEASLGGPWECPDCGKLFRSLQQVVAHARVHLQKPHKGHQRDEESLLRGGGGGGEGGARRGGSNSSGGGGVTNSSSDSRTEPKLSQTRTGMAGGFHSLLAPFSGENGLRGVAAGSSLAPRERVRGKGMKDCPYCGKAFRSSHHLKVHLRVHTGERPYKCPHCDYAGTQSGSLKYHLQRHHREQQRNALASSPGLPTLPLPPRSNESSSAPKQRLAQSLAQLGVFGRTGVATTTPADTQTVTSRHSQAWARASQEEKGQKGSAASDAAAAAAAALKEGDLERQYHFLSGVMGALYQGRMPEAGWVGEMAGQGPPPAKQPKVSRRKPLTTSRMVPTNGHGGGGGGAPSSLSPSPPLQGRTQEGGFEPLDLSSRRNLPEMAGGERRRKREASGGERRRGAEEGGGGGAGAVTLTQCLFCPFRTSSAELMAMHLQVNHTSKSRRKRSSPLPLPAAAPATSPAPPSATSSVPATTTAPEPDQLALWRYISGQDEVPSVPAFQDDQALFAARAPPRENGLGLEEEEEEEELEQEEEEELLQHEVDEDGDLASDTYEPSVSSTLHEKEEEEMGEGMGEMDEEEEGEEEEEEEEEEDEDERKKRAMKSGRMARLEALHAMLSGRSPGGGGAASPRMEEGMVGD